MHPRHTHYMYSQAIIIAGPDKDQQGVVLAIDKEDFVIKKVRLLQYMWIFRLLTVSRTTTRRSLCSPSMWPSTIPPRSSPTVWLFFHHTTMQH